MGMNSRKKVLICRKMHLLTHLKGFFQHYSKYLHFQSKKLQQDLRRSGDKIQNPFCEALADAIHKTILSFSFRSHADSQKD